MPSPRVSIRLGTDGKAQVVKDFADIGDAGDAQSRRIAAAFARDSALAEASLEKLNKTANRLAAVSAAPGAPTNLINPITGGSYAQADGAAQASARAIVSAQDQAEVSAKRLLASIDPLYAAQMRYDTALAEATALQAQGALSAEQLATVQTGLKAQLAAATAGQVESAAATQSSRFAMQDLNRVVTRSADAYAAGFSPLRIMTMEMGRLDRAAMNLSGAGIGGSLGGLLSFLSGPWGIALIIGTAALAPMIAKLFETGDGVDSLVDKLKKEAEQQKLNDQAHNIFAATLDGVTAATKRNEDETKKLSDQNHSAAQQALAHALAQIDLAKTIRDTTAAQLAQAQATLAVMAAEERRTGGGEGGVAETAIGAQQAQIAALQATLSEASSDIDKNQALVLSDMSRLSVEAVDKMSDPIQRIKSKYEILIEQARQHAQQLANAARAAGDEAKAQALVTIELQKQLAPLKIKEQAEIDAEQARNRKGPANAGGTAIFDAQIAKFFDEAKKFRGDSETGDKGVLEAFFRAANENIDPEKTAWCAAFVNAVLAAGGVHGTGSLAAKSFLNFGKDDTHSPQQGDIVVLRTGAGEHVGFLDSINNKTGAVSVLAGNTGNRVAEATYSKNQVLAIRRPPTPSEAAAFEDKEADRARGELTAYDTELSKLHDQYLTALQKTLSSADESSLAQEKLARGQHDAVALQIGDNLAEAKYGDATSDLAKARARQLLEANDEALSQKQAAIAQAAYVKTSLKLQEAADQRYQYQIDDLKFADEFARSSKEKRQLDLEILDIEYRKKELDLEELKKRQIEQLQFAAADDTQRQIDQLPHQKAQDVARVDHSTMSPWQQFLDQLPHGIAEIDDALQKAAVDGLQDFNNGLAEAIANGKSFGDVLHQSFSIVLADLIKLGLQLAESALFGKGTSGNGGLLSSIISGITSIVGGVSGGAGGGDFSGGGGTGASQGFSGPPGDAVGTQYAPGGYAWVGEFGKELVRLPRGSMVTPANESRRIEAANDRNIGSINIPINIDATGADAAALARTNEELRQLRSDLPALVAQHWSDANGRFLFRGQRQ